MTDLLKRLEPFQQTYTYREVVARDNYRMRLIASPEAIYDIGANRGIFTLWAKHCHPKAEIIAVEADADNFATLEGVCQGIEGVNIMHAALGNGPIYHRVSDDPGKHCYHSEQVGYSRESLESCKSLHRVNVRAISLGELLRDEKRKYALKIDVEAAEGVLLNDRLAEVAFRRAEYVAMELHFWAMEKRHNEEAATARLCWLAQFRDTHCLEFQMWRSGGMVWMTKRGK